MVFNCVVARVVARVVTALLASAAVANAGSANPTCTTQQSGCSSSSGGSSGNQKVNLNVNTGGRRRLTERQLSGGESEPLIEGTVTITIDGKAPPKPDETISEEEAEQCTSCTDFCQDVLSEFAPACDTLGISLSDLELLNSDDAVVEDPEFPRCDDCEFFGEKTFCVEIVEDDVGHPDFQLVSSQLSFQCKLPRNSIKCSISFDLAIDGLFEGEALLDGEASFDGEELDFTPLEVTAVIYDPTSVPTPVPVAEPPKSCKERCEDTCKCWCEDLYPWLSSRSCRRKCRKKCNWLCEKDDSANFEDIFTGTPEECIH